MLDGKGGRGVWEKVIYVTKGGGSVYNTPSLHDVIKGQPLYFPRHILLVFSVFPSCLLGEMKPNPNVYVGP